MEFRIKKLKLCEIIWNRSASEKNLLDALTNDINSCNLFSENQVKQIKERLRKHFLPDYNKKWKEVSRTRNVFLTKFADFVENDFVVKLSEENTQIPPHPPTLDIASQRVDRGRPCVSFEEASEKTKKRRVSDIFTNISRAQLLSSCKISDPKRKSDPQPNSRIEDPLFLSRVLAMYVDSDYTRQKYNNFREHDEKMYGTKRYPPYPKLQIPRAECFPEHISATETGAKVNFISLLVHTTKRILLTVDLNEVEKCNHKKLTLYGKWGMDGASGQQTTRQQWKQSKVNLLSDSIDSKKLCNLHNERSEVYEGKSRDDAIQNEIEYSDKAVFFISFAPLLLCAGESIVWQNVTPSSVKYCRPIHFEFTKETDKMVQNVYTYYTKILENVETYSFDIEGHSFEVSFDIKCTMIDGKICNVLTGQKASSRCNICGVGPKFVNDFNHLATLPCKEEFYKFGLSTLHAWIRCLEYMLHVSYNMDFEKGSARTTEHKEMKQIKKQRVQKLLKTELSLTVDVVKQGSGTTNTGNVAREFFNNAEKVAKITGLNEELISRFHTILQLLSCGKMIDSEKFEVFALDTAKLCVQLYPWYSMPPAIHKILIHGSKVIKCFHFPIGWYSEECQEANNKIFRNARLNHSRMVSRESSNLDIMHYFMINTDPFISSLRIKEKKREKLLTEYAQRFLF